MLRSTCFVICMFQLYIFNCCNVGFRSVTAAKYSSITTPMSTLYYPRDLQSCSLHTVISVSYTHLDVYKRQFYGKR